MDRDSENPDETANAQDDLSLYVLESLNENFSLDTDNTG